MSITTGGGAFSDIITWVRRLIKSPSPQAISNATISDYINRFVLYDLAERNVHIELQRQYTFETQENVFMYQAPYSPASQWNFPSSGTFPPFVQYEAGAAQVQTPLYQNFRPPIFADGIRIGWLQFTDQFYNIFPELVLNEQPAEGDGTTGPYTFTVSRSPIIRAFIDELGFLLPYVYITWVDSSGDQHYVVDSGYYDSTGQGLLIETDSTFQEITGASLGVGTPPTSGGAGTVNYSTGEVTFTTSGAVIDSGTTINVQTSPFSSGRPTMAWFRNNLFHLYPIPDRPYKIQVDCDITPFWFFQQTDATPFAYMSEYIALGAARKILSDNGDVEQLNLYEGRFREQESLVMRKSTRQRAVIRTPTIFSGQTMANPYVYTQY